MDTSVRVKVSDAARHGSRVSDPSRGAGMKVKLNYTGYLKFDGAATGAILDVEEGSTIGDLLAGFDVAPEQQRFLRLFVGEEKADPSRVIHDGDELTVIMQIGGG